MTIETTSKIKDEITNQVTRKLGDIRSDLNSQILQAINTRTAEKVLPTIHYTTSKQETGNSTVVDRRSGELHMNLKLETLGKRWKTALEMDLN